MVTASSEKDTIITCIKAGCNDYIMKPFNMETVVKKLVTPASRSRWKENGLDGKSTGT